jgi:hypothetical protein
LHLVRILVRIRLARLKSIVEERARLLVATIDLEAFEKHLLVLGASSLELLLLFLGLEGSRFDRWGLIITTTHHASRGTDGAVSNSGPSSKGHTLRNCGSNATHHSPALGGCWSRSTGGRLGTSRNARHRLASRWLAATKHASASTSTSTTRTLNIQQTHSQSQTKPVAGKIIETKM